MWEEAGTLKCFDFLWMRCRRRMDSSCWLVSVSLFHIMIDG